MAEDFKIIGERLKKARLNKGLTQEQLSEKMDFSVPYLSKIETGKVYINLKRLFQICELLDVTPGEILNGASHTLPNYLSPEINEYMRMCSFEKQQLIFKIIKLLCEES